MGAPDVERVHELGKCRRVVFDAVVPAKRVRIAMSRHRPRDHAETWREQWRHRIVLVGRSAVGMHEYERVSASELTVVYASMVPRFREAILDSGILAVHAYLTCFVTILQTGDKVRSCGGGSTQQPSPGG